MNRYLKATSSRTYKTLVPSFTAGINTEKDARILPLNQAEMTVNFCTNTGALTEGYGLTDAQIRNAWKVWQYRRYDEPSQKTEAVFMYCSKQGRVYYRREGEMNFTELSEISFSSPPFAIGYRLYGEDVIILCSATDRMAVWNGVARPYTVPSSPFVTSLCMHFERMFVTIGGQKNAVWFSDDLDPTNWNPDLDEGGFIELMDERGRLNRVLSFNNYVYIFRDYGISRLSAYAEQTEFSAVNLFVSSGRIFADTAVVCGDVILFLASDGFYSFDGVSTRKLLTSLSGLLCSGGTPTASYLGGKYWAAFQADFNDYTSEKNENNCLLSLERHSGTFSLTTGIDVRALCPINNGDSEKLYAVLSDGRVGTVEKTGTMFGEPLKKVWQSGLIDFGSPDKTKLLREIFLDTKTDIVLTVRTDRAEKRFAVKGKSGISHVRVNMLGTKIGLTITAESAKASVARPMVTYALLR